MNIILSTLKSDTKLIKGKHFCSRVWFFTFFDTWKVRIGIYLNLSEVGTVEKECSKTWEAQKIITYAFLYNLIVKLKNSVGEQWWNEMIREKTSQRFFKKKKN